MLRNALISLAIFTLFGGVAQAQIPTLTLGASASVHLVPPGPIKADGKRISLTVVVVDSDGSLAADARFRGSSAKLGRFDSDCSATRPGVYSCSYTAPERVATGESIRIKARLPSGTNLEGTFPVELRSSGKARISTTASPKSMVLTQDEATQLSITIKDASGAPVEDADIRARANVGSIDDLHSNGPGLWAGRYIPFDAAGRPFPQVAIVSIWDANNPGRSQDFQIIPLIGKVTFPVNTGVAGARVRFQVGDKTFPEVVSGADGQALVPIEVPPGVPRAKVSLSTPNGSTSNQNIDLMVPGFGRIGLGGLPDYLPADGEASTRIRVLVVDSRGKPASGEDVLITSDVGTTSAVRFVGDGVYEANFTAPSLTSAGTATISASVKGDAASQVSGKIGLELPGPKALALSANPAELSAGTKKSTITAQVTGPDGQPGGKLYSVELRTAAGPLRKLSNKSTGTFSTDLSVDWKTKTRVTGIARMRGNKQAVQSLLLLPMHEAVVTNQRTPISVLSLDRYGNPVSGVPVNCSATGGGSVTSSGQTDAFGMTAVVFTASSLGGFATVTCEGAGVSYTAPIWQTADAMDDFRFPVGGGQTQGSLLARWSKLASRIDLAPAKAEPEPAVAATTPATSSGSGAWGADPAATDSGSVAAAGAPTAIQVSTLPASLPTSGGTANIMVRVTDANGLLVPGANVILLSDVGSISGKTDNGDGTFSATLFIPPNSGKERVQVTATRPAGDIAGFSTIAVGGSAVAAATPKKKKKAPVPAGDRMQNRSARVWVGWTPGGYSYMGTPCANEEGPCDEPASADLDNYDFLKAEIAAPTLGTFSVGGEWFPFQDYVGIQASYTNASFSTDFSTSTAEGDYCSTHFCDTLNYFQAGAQGRISLLKDKGPLDILVRAGLSGQDVTVFWRRADDDGNKEARFETVNLLGFRAGAGVRFSVTPKLQPHFGYDATFGIQASLGENSFGVPGIISHEVVGGVTFFPWKGLLLDVSYVGRNRALGLSYSEDGVIQRGSINESGHSVRLSAGWAF